MVRGVGRVWEGRNFVFRQKFICGDSPVSRGIVMVRDPIAGTPLLRVKSAHSVADALQDSFVEFLIYRLSSRDVLMMNQPVNVEERNQHRLDIGLHLPRFLRRGVMQFSAGRTFALFPGHTRKPSSSKPREWGGPGSLGAFAPTAAAATTTTTTITRIKGRVNYRSGAKGLIKFYSDSFVFYQGRREVLILRPNGTRWLLLRPKGTWCLTLRSRGTLSFILRPRSAKIFSLRPRGTISFNLISRETEVSVWD